MAAALNSQSSLSPHLSPPLLRTTPSPTSVIPQLQSYLLSKNYTALQCASLSHVIGDTACQPITGKKNVKMFPKPYYKYDCNTVCLKNFIPIRSLAYRLGYHKAIILLLLCYPCMNHYTCK